MHTYIAAVGWQNVLQFVAVVFIFVVILLITHFTTKWIGGIQKKQAIGKNISSIEVFRLANNKYIQIIKVGEDYLAIAVTKDKVTFLGKIDKEGLDLKDETATEGQSFGSVLDVVKNFKDKKF